MQPSRHHLNLTGSSPHNSPHAVYMHQASCKLIGKVLVPCLFHGLRAKRQVSKTCLHVQGGLAAQPSGNSWGQPGSPGSRPGTAGSYRRSEDPPSASKLASFQQMSFNKANSGALSEVSCGCAAAPCIICVSIIAFTYGASLCRLAFELWCIKLLWTTCSERHTHHTCYAYLTWHGLESLSTVINKCG